MSLLRDYNNLGATKLKNFTKGVIDGLSSDAIFTSLATDVTALTALNTALGLSILPFNESTKLTNDEMMNKKSLVVKKLDEILPLADTICGNDIDKERSSGFTSSKRGRTRRTFIAPAHIAECVSTGVPGQVLITLTASIPGNTGYEVHYIADGKDYIAGTYKVRNRTLQILASGFPSGKTVSVYLITLSTNSLRSTPSNYVPAAAA